MNVISFVIPRIRKAFPVGEMTVLVLYPSSMRASFGRETWPDKTAAIAAD
jgi:hypothetical protein